MLPGICTLVALGASADDGKRTLHAMKRSFTFIPLLEHPLTCQWPRRSLGRRGWQDFGILILAGLFKAFSDRRLTSL